MEVGRVTSAPRESKFEKGFKTVNFKVSPEDYRIFRIRAGEYGVTVSDVCRLALADEEMWKRAAEKKAQDAKEKEGGE